jgi:cell division septal protein FtsQ
LKPGRVALLLSALLLALFGVADRAPLLLRDFDAFNVERVDVVGARHVAANEILGAAGITPQSNLFDDVEPWRQGLLSHPLIADVRIERRPGATLLLQVTEARPVALARASRLRAIDAEGTALPLDPATTGLDLPILGVAPEFGDGGRVEDPATLAALGALERIRQLDAELFAVISEVLPFDEAAVRLRLSSPARLDVLLATELGGESLKQLRLVLADVQSRGELGRLRHLDARFRDQVVVALEPPRR